MSVVPIIDIAPAFVGSERTRRAIATKIGNACEEIGFLMVTGHGIPRKLVDEIDGLSRMFFDLPLDEKMRIAIQPGKSRGYRRVGISSLAAKPGQGRPPPDLRESLVTGPYPDAGDPYYRSAGAKRFFEANVWPERPAGLQRVFQAYFDACTRLSSRLMQLFAVALDLPEGFFDDKINRPISGLTATYYPKQTVSAQPGQLRAGPHTDYGSVTVLATDSSPGGLQVSVGGTWQDVMPIPDAFILNLGDLMAQWTNNRWRSTLHRVINPPPDVASSTDRLSVVYFHQPNFDAPIECLPTCLESGEQPKYASTTSGEHLAAQIARTYAEKPVGS